MFRGTVDKSKIAWAKRKTHVLADIKAKGDLPAAVEEHIDAWYAAWYAENEEHEDWMARTLDECEEANQEAEVNKQRAQNLILLQSYEADYKQEREIIQDTIVIINMYLQTCKSLVDIVENEAFKLSF